MAPRRKTTKTIIKTDVNQKVDLPDVSLSVDTTESLTFRVRDADSVNFPKTSENKKFLMQFDSDELIVYIDSKLITKRDFDKL